MVWFGYHKMKYCFFMNDITKLNYPFYLINTLNLKSLCFGMHCGIREQHRLAAAMDQLVVP